MEAYMKESKTLDAAAKVIRVVTVPPVLITAMLVILGMSIEGFYNNAWEAAVSIILLGFVPVAAYPLQKLIPKYKAQKREGQRNFAFVMTFFGYLAAVIVSCVNGYGIELRFIIVSYFISMVMLVLLNMAAHIKASGHACSISGSLFFLSFFLGVRATIPCVLIMAAIIWSSLRLKRHKLKELLWGMAACLPCMIASFFIL